MSQVSRQARICKDRKTNIVYNPKFENRSYSKIVDVSQRSNFIFDVWILDTDISQSNWFWQGCISDTFDYQRLDIPMEFKQYSHLNSTLCLVK